MWFSSYCLSVSLVLSLLSYEHRYYRFMFSVSYRDVETIISVISRDIYTDVTLPVIRKIPEKKQTNKTQTHYS